jgi:hypothetical protein
MRTLEKIHPPRLRRQWRGIDARRGAGRDDAGAVLILALVFLLVVGGIVGSLAAWATNDLDNTAHFTSARSLQYAAESAVELAIQNIRYTPLLLATQADPTPTLNASPPVACWGTAPSEPPAVDGQSLAVWCSTVWYPSSSFTRVVTISACPVTSTMTAASCAQNPYLQAVVTFDDYPPGGVSAPNTTTPVPCLSPAVGGYCGTTMSVNSWDWSPVVPTVSSISPASGLITGGTITVTGSGFVAGATSVNFVSESGGTPNEYGVIAPIPAPGSAVVPAVGIISVPASSVTVTNGGTSLTSLVPAVDQGTTFFVTVTTSGGTSSYDPNPNSPSANDIYTYLTNVSPSISGISVSGISPPAGSNTGGTAVTITGIGFYNGASNAVVTFVGSVTKTAITFVNSPTSITAFSPNVSPATGSFYITVTTPGGTTTSHNFLFAYSQLQANGG